MDTSDTLHVCDEVPRMSQNIEPKSRGSPVFAEAEALEPPNSKSPKLRKPEVLGPFKKPTWVVVKMMVPFCVPIIIGHLLFRVPKKGP